MDLMPSGNKRTPFYNKRNDFEIARMYRLHSPVLCSFVGQRPYFACTVKAKVELNHVHSCTR